MIVKCEICIHREKKKNGKKKDVTSSKKLEKQDKKLKKKTIECHYCHRNFFDEDNFLDIIRIWDGVMHLFVFLDVEFTRDQELLRYRGNMADFNHFTCCDYLIHKGCMIHSWYMFHQLA